MIEVYAGPMFAGKSSELVRHGYRAAHAKWKVRAFVPNTDTRAAGRIVTHNKTDLEELTGIVPEVVGLASSVRAAVDCKLVLIDEAQFFATDIVGAVEHLSGAGVHVVVAGLDLDSDGRPFGSMGALMAVADTVVKLRAICACDRPATRTRAKFDKRDVVSIGGGDRYAAQCRYCWAQERHVLP